MRKKKKKPTIIDMQAFLTTHQQGKEFKVKFSKTETCVIGPLESNVWGTRHFISVGYYEDDSKFPFYSYGVSSSSKMGALRAIIERLSEHNFQFK